MKCPQCGSENCHYVTKTETNGSLFSGLDACCGMLFLGPAGLLCGLCGSNISSETKEYWVCDNCGRKFSATEAQKSIQNNKQLNFYYDDVLKYPEKASKTMVKVMDAAFDDEEGRYKDFLNRIIIRKDDFERNKEIFKNVVERVNEGELILFAYHDAENVIVTWNAIYFNDTYIQWEAIKLLSIWKNTIYFNQTALVFSAESARDAFLNIINNFIPEVEIYYSECYPELLSRLQCMPNDVCTRNSHFSSKAEYSSFVNELLERKVMEYSSVNGDKYTKYLQIKQEKDEEEKKIWKTVLATGGVIGLFSLFKWGFGIGILILILAEIIGVIAAEYYLTRDEWNEYRMELLPELLIQLIDEQKRSDIKKTGQIRVEDYETDFRYSLPIKLPSNSSESKDSLDKKNILDCCKQELEALDLRPRNMMIGVMAAIIIVIALQSKDSNEKNTVVENKKDEESYVSMDSDDVQTFIGVMGNYTSTSGGSENSVSMEIHDSGNGNIKVIFRSVKNKGMVSAHGNVVGRDTVEADWNNAHFSLVWTDAGEVTVSRTGITGYTDIDSFTEYETFINNSYYQVG